LQWEEASWLLLLAGWKGRSGGVAWDPAQAGKKLDEARRNGFECCAGASDGVRRMQVRVI